MIAAGAAASVGERLGTATEALRRAGLEQPRLEATLLVALALGTRREWVIAHPEQHLTPAQQSYLGALLTRRLAREPLAYLRGSQEFYGRDFLVNDSVLIPRPETELLVEVAVHACARAKARGWQHPLVVDLGTGCGAIAVTVALECPSARVIGLDISATALHLARRNADRLNACNVHLATSDLLAAVRGPIDVLLGNLPYIPNVSWLGLQPELHYEPRLALLGGPSGLEIIERALIQARALLAPAAEVVLEIEEKQGQASLDLASRAIPDAQPEVLRDHAGLDRLLHMCRPGLEGANTNQGRQVGLAPRRTDGGRGTAWESLG